jgi:hypothetical protein
MTTDHSLVGCEAIQPLEHWLPVLEDWLLLLDRCCRLAPPSIPISPPPPIIVPSPWLLMERTNVALLGSAACRSGWIALSERFISEDSSSNDAADLLLYLQDGKAELVEAKYGQIKEAEEKLEAAVQEAAGRRPPRPLDAARRIGIAFILFDDRTEYNEERLNVTLEKIRSVSHDASAWYLPANQRKYSYYNHREKLFSPGVVLLARSQP